MFHLYYLPDRGKNYQRRRQNNNTKPCDPKHVYQMQAPLRSVALVLSSGALNCRPKQTRATTDLMKEMCLTLQKKQSLEKKP